MKRSIRYWLAGLAMVLAGVLVVTGDADAKRLGGGKSIGLQRSAPDAPAKPPTQAQPAQPAAPGATPASPATPGAAAAAAPAGAAAAAASPGRRWLAPVAGLAAGLGLAALASSLGFGEELASFVMLALLAVVAIVVIRLLMRRFAGGAAAPQGMRYAAAGSAPLGNAARAERTAMPDERVAAPTVEIGSALGAPQAAQPAAVPADFDAEGFERIAKAIFVRMQAANDAANLDDLRRFTTPELFAELRVDLLDRGPAAQHTDVLEVDAKVRGVAEEDGQQIVSVGYTGRVREQDGAEPADFDEVWHLVRASDGSGSWSIAGIQQRQPA